MHGSVSLGGSHIRVVVLVNEVLPFVLDLDGVGIESRLSFLSDVIRDNESSKSSFDLVVSCSSSLEEEVLVWVAAIQHYAWGRTLTSVFEYSRKGLLF